MSETQQKEPVTSETAASNTDAGVIEIGAGADTGVGIETSGMQLEFADIKQQAIEFLNR